MKSLLLILYLLLIKTSLYSQIYINRKDTSKSFAYKLNLPEDSINFYNFKIDSLKKELSNYHGKLANILYNYGEYELASFEIKKALKLDEGNFLLAGSIYLKLNKIDVAHDYFYYQYLIDSNNKETIFKLGVCSYLLKEYNKALKYFTIVDRNDLVDSINYYKAQCYFKLKQKDSSMLYFFKCTNYPDSKIMLGNFYFRKRDFVNSIIWYSKYIENNDSNIIIYNKRAISYYNIKDFKNSLNDCNVSISIKPNFEAYIIIGNILNAESKFNEACLNYKKAISINPKIKLKDLPLKCH
jgi:tetratricopeptide (TPR) repeat protein